jgi:hypothetical protein
MSSSHTVFAEPSSLASVADTASSSTANRTAVQRPRPRTSGHSSVGPGTRSPTSPTSTSPPWRRAPERRGSGAETNTVAATGTCTSPLLLSSASPPPSSSSLSWLDDEGSTEVGDLQVELTAKQYLLDVANVSAGLCARARRAGSRSAVDCGPPRAGCVGRGVRCGEWCALRVDGVCPVPKRPVATV